MILFYYVQEAVWIIYTVRWLVTSSSLQRPRFDPRALTVGFVVCEVALGHYSFPHHNCYTIDVIYLNK